MGHQPTFISSFSSFCSTIKAHCTKESVLDQIGVSLPIQYVLGFWSKIGTKKQHQQDKDGALPRTPFIHFLPLPTFIVHPHKLLIQMPIKLQRLY